MGLDSLAGYEGQHVGVVLNHLARHEQADLTREACGFLAGLQARNDTGLTWGQALTEATTEARKYAAARAAERSHP
jgi:imidazoleglycerol phosphate dehydratase HisB